MPITIDNSGLSGAFGALGQAVSGYNAGRQTGLNYQLSLDKMQRQANINQAAQEQEMVRFQQKQQYMAGLRRQQYLEGLGFEEVMDVPSKTMYQDLRNEEVSVMGMLQESEITQEAYNLKMADIQNRRQKIKKTVRPIQGMESWMRPGLHAADEIPDGNPLKDGLEDSAIEIDGKKVVPGYRIEPGGRIHFNLEPLELKLKVQQAKEEAAAKQLIGLAKAQQGVYKDGMKVLDDTFKDLSLVESPSSDEALKEWGRRMEIRIKAQSKLSGEAPVQKTRTATPANLPSPKTTAEYSKLPPGTKYLHPTKGVVVKQ